MNPAALVNPLVRVMISLLRCIRFVAAFCAVLFTFKAMPIIPALLSGAADSTGLYLFMLGIAIAAAIAAFLLRRAINLLDAKSGGDGALIRSAWRF